MDIMIQGLALVVAALCAAVMGLAIQRGATCTVAAVEEVMQRGSGSRLLALIEASIWVGGGMLVLDRLHLLARMPAGFALGANTLLGAVLLGLGAFVNRACVFGAIARFGSGEWAYIMTPVGFYLGCLGVAAVPARASGMVIAAPSALFDAPVEVAWAFLAFFVWRLAHPMLRDRGALRRQLAERVWTPHAATCVIGVMFLATLVLAGSWAYTDALADLARGMTRNLSARMLLAASLFAGAAVGGWKTTRFHRSAPRAGDVLRCLLGGGLMGCGSVLIPGSNDGLILVGLPLLRPYAWVAFGTMCAAIAVAHWASARFVRTMVARQ
jgi:toxin CptA